MNHGLAICCLIGGLLTVSGFAQEAQPDRPGQVPEDLEPAVLIQFGSRDQTLEINPLSETYFLRKLARAEQLQARLVIVEIDSPGGMIDSSLNLANALRETTWAKTVAYVPRQALSGAAIMALGCDEIVMSETAHIGDAGPIFMGEDFLFRHAPEKIRSDLVSKVRTLCEATGRPPAIAEAMVDMDLEVYKVTHADTGEISYMSDAELRALEDPTEWNRGPLLEPSKKGRFLELDGKLAFEVELADATANSRADLAERFQVELDGILIMESTWVDTLVTVLNLWPVTIVLVVVGLIALYMELAAPGIGIGGLVAGLCFALFFWSRFLGGTAGWLEVVLFAAGVVFLLVELFVIPGFGIAGLSGILLLIISCIMAGQRWGTADGLSAQQLVNSMFLVTTAGAGSIIGIAVITKYFGGLALFQKLAIQSPDPEPDGADSIGSESRAAIPSASIGDEGVAESPLRPAGRVLFGEHSRDVMTEGSFVDKGARVRIVKLSGTHITVREIA